MNDSAKHLKNIPKGCLDRQKYGVSSFYMHDSQRVFHEIGINEGQSFLDIGCGSGDYSIHAAKLVGHSGIVYSVDRWITVIDSLREKAVEHGLKNIKPMQCDITKGIPLEDHSVDVCLMATILHALDLTDTGNKIFSEIKRLLKKDGKLVTIDVKKEEMPFGPPMHLRLFPIQIENILKIYGFNKTQYIDLGYNYMMQFQKTSS